MFNILPKRALPQPKPHVSTPGDCGPCVLSGLTGVKVEDIYTSFTDDGKAEPFNYVAMTRVLERMQFAGYFDRVNHNAPIWNVHPGTMVWGVQADALARPWFSYITMAIDAKYYGIIMVDFDKRGSASGGPNHWQLLCGARDSFGVNEVLISCSATGKEEWVSVESLLRYRGGYNVMLVRPT